MTNRTEATFEFDVNFEFENENGELRIIADIENAWIGDGSGNEWHLWISLPNERSKQGYNTQDGEVIAIDPDNVDDDALAEQLELAETCFDDQLEFAIEQWLCGRHVVADSPRGFANEVNFVIGNGDKEDDDSQQLIDYLMSTPYDWDGNTVKFVENE